MKFESISIKQVVTDIETGKIFLPPIQRNFVWNYERIVKLFDSLYRNYPIGNCIFWKLKPETSQNYPLYKFIKEFSENKNKAIKNEHISSNLLEQDVYAVVDGQQRLSSLFIGLAGTYKYKKSGKGLQNVDSNFITSKLFINLLALDAKTVDEELFDFLGEEDAKVMNDRKLWFEVGKILIWKNAEQAETYISEITPEIIATNKKTLITRFENKKAKIIATLKTLFQILNEKRLYYFDIENQNLDEVVDIFTRVNSGGMSLKKSDLLFSILVAQWNDGRDEIKELIESMRESDVSISQDFVMRCCLVLSDLPIKYKLESFTTKNISLIKKNWNEIKSSLIKLCELLPEIGYINHPNLSDNSLIPIAYYIKKGGDIKTKKARKALQQYYVVAQVNAIYGGQGEQVLEKIRTEIKKQLTKDKLFNYQELTEVKLPGSKTFKLTLTDLEYLVETTVYGSHHDYFLLSLIYPTVDFKVRRYEVDHIHPKSKFNNANLRNNGILDEETIEYWKSDKCNMLPNLQLLGNKDNNNKRSKTIIEYLNGKTPKERKEFKQDNVLPSNNRLLELKNFDDFFEFRKRQLVSRLKKHFDI